MEKFAGDDCLVFYVNGEKFEVSDADPTTTLLEFLRSRTPFKSVKLGCGEGASTFNFCFFQVFRSTFLCFFISRRFSDFLVLAEWLLFVAYCALCFHGYLLLFLCPVVEVCVLVSCRF